MVAPSSARKDYEQGYQTTLVVECCQLVGPLAGGTLRASHLAGGRIQGHIGRTTAACHDEQRRLTDFLEPTCIREGETMRCCQYKSFLTYIPFWGTIGGLMGSFIGFSIYNHVLGALLGGLVGIVGCEAMVKAVFRRQEAKQGHV